jgi:hypothetical protein
MPIDSACGMEIGEESQFKIGRQADFPVTNTPAFHIVILILLCPQAELLSCVLV